ncbi:unnamed protein product [Symbiodinium sp. CCMP2592]|nr:unnamed protein product [Symbiodinium sp. CCMP2592]
MAMQDDKVTPRHQSMAEVLKDLEVHEWTVHWKSSCAKKARRREVAQMQDERLPQGQKSASAGHRMICRFPLGTTPLVCTSRV